jgi:plasmid stability protein
VGEGKRPLPVRVDDRMRTALEERAAADGLRPSTWAREILAAVLATKLTAFELQAVLRGRQQLDPQELTDGVVVSGPKSTNGRPSTVNRLGRRVILTGDCLCPVHLRRQLPTHDVCAHCAKRHDRV